MSVIRFFFIQWALSTVHRVQVEFYQHDDEEETRYFIEISATHDYVWSGHCGRIWI